MWEKEKLLVTSNFSFSHDVFKKSVLQTRKNKGLLGNGLRTGGRWFDPAVGPIFFSRIDEIHCDRIHSPLTAVRYFYDGYVGQQPMDCEEYCAEYWLKVLQESMDRCTGRPHMIEILDKTALNTMQSVNLISWQKNATILCRYVFVYAFCISENNMVKGASFLNKKILLV